MFELIPLGNVNVLNVAGDQKCFECIMDLCSAKDCLCPQPIYISPLCKEIGVSDSVG